MPQNNTSSSSFLGRLTTSTRSSFMSPKDVRCNVHLLHDSDIIGNEFPRTQSAQTILDYVCEMKHIREKDFLGLRYQDHNKHRYWLDLTRSIGHVVKHFRTETMTLHLRFRYYPAEPARLRDPNLRYQLFVQLQRDLLHGRLYCPTSSAAELAALILQTQLGDHDEEKHIGNYVSGYKLLLKQTPKLEERIAQFHKQMKGKTSEDAELEFLEKASQLDTYAFDPYTIKDPQDSGPVYLGASCKGILIYAGQSRTHNIEWNELVKVDYSGKEIRLTLSDTYRGQVTAAGTPTGTLNGHGPGSPISGTSGMDKYQVKKPMTLKYTCPSAQFAKHLWIHILSQQAFFNETSAHDVKLKFSKPRIPLLSRGSTFRFPSKRVYREIEEDDAKSILFDKSILETSAVMNETTTSNENAEESILNCSTMSVPTSTCSGVVRYELPRQTPRTEQPWLKPTSLKVTASHDNTDTIASSSSSPDSSTENQNNNLSKITDLNVDMGGEGSSSPSSTSPVVPIIHTQQNSDHNSTSFTVHLIKREEISTSSTSTSSTVSGVPREQTRAQALERKFNQLVEEEMAIIGQPLASSTPRSAKQNLLGKSSNGQLANGGYSSDEFEKKTVHTNGHALITTEEKQDSLVDLDESTSTKKSLVSRVANTCFVAFLILLLIIAVVIVLFERSEGSAHNDFIEKNRALSDLRHLYYEPTRHYVVEQYRKYFGPKI